VKTTLEIPDPIFRKAKATASALGIPLREYVTQAVEEKLFQGNRRPGRPWLECARARGLDLILDTYALSAYPDRTPEAVEIVSGARELAIPVIVAGEFTLGFVPSRYREAYERSLQRMLDRCTVLEIGIETAWHYRPSGWN
jgi:hypothetical protein